MALCCTLWSIWKSRNLVVFEGKPADPLDTMFRINLLLSDCELHIREEDFSTDSMPGNTSRVGKYWRPPVRGGLKINCDASYNKNSKRGHTGIIIRGESGEFITGLTNQFWATSPLVAEALALRDAVFLAANLGLRVVTFEGDNLDLIKACRKEICRREISNILQDIWGMRGHFIRCGFTWISRQGNKVAHLAAALAEKGDLPTNWCVSLPRLLMDALEDDCSCTRPSTSMSHLRGDEQSVDALHFGITNNDGMNSVLEDGRDSPPVNQTRMGGSVSTCVGGETRLSSNLMADGGVQLRCNGGFCVDEDQRVFDDGG